MEELLELSDQIEHHWPISNRRQLGESWEDISLKMKRTLELPNNFIAITADLPKYSRKKSMTQVPKAPNPKLRLQKEETKKDKDVSAGNSRVRLKILRSITDDDNLDSYHNSLTKRSNTETKCSTQLSKAPALQTEAPSLQELNLNGPTLLRSSHFSKGSRQQQKINPQSRLKLNNRYRPDRENNGEEVNDSNLIIIKEENYRNNLKLSKTPSAHLVQQSPKEVIIPAKIDILIKQKCHSEPKCNEKMISGYFRKSIHAHEYSHLRLNRNQILPLINYSHYLTQDKKTKMSIHSTNSKQKWMFVHRSLSKTESKQDLGRMRQRELQQRLQRELIQASKQHKIFSNGRQSKLKLK